MCHAYRQYFSLKRRLKKKETQIDGQKRERERKINRREGQIEKEVYRQTEKRDTQRQKDM